jgi:hypothetical protein
MALAVIGALSLGNTVELTTGDLRRGSAFDNLKATFGQKLKIGDISSNLDCEYDHSAKSDFLKEATLSGDLVSASKDSDIGVSYEVTKNFADESTSAKLTASTTIEGTALSAQLDGGLSEVTAGRTVNAGDETVDVEASWMVKAKTARVKLMSKLSANDNVNVQVDYTPDGGKVDYEVTLDHDLGNGRDVSAKGAGGVLEVDYTDTKFEKDATWTASASVPYDMGSNIMDAVKVSLKRSWKW